MKTIEVDTHFAAATAVVTEAHAGQFRADGKTPYVVHPIEVARRVRKKIDDMPYPEVKHLGITYHSIEDENVFLLIALLAAIGHDVKEDNPDFPLLERWIAAGIPPRAVTAAITIIDRLSNVAGGDYLDYILSLRAKADWITLLVKEEDMNTNWDDTDNLPSGRRKAMRTTYLLAHYILFGRKPYAALR